jgi:hypothetical protein
LPGNPDGSPVSRQFCWLIIMTQMWRGDKPLSQDRRQFRTGKYRKNNLMAEPGSRKNVTVNHADGKRAKRLIFWMLLPRRSVLQTDSQEFDKRAACALLAEFGFVWFAVNSLEFDCGQPGVPVRFQALSFFSKR